jgi:hypothetical protein
LAGRPGNAGANPLDVDVVTADVGLRGSAGFWRFREDEDVVGEADSREGEDEEIGQ